MKNKIKIIIGSIITVLTCCIFLITSHAQAGYEINDNGNIESLNLFNIDDLNTNTYLIINGNSFTLYSNYGYPNSIFNKNINWESNTQYTFSGIKSNTTGNNRIDIKYSDGTLQDIATEVNGYFSVTSQSGKTIVDLICDYSSNGQTTYSNFMVNEGTVALDYFPYGNYTNEENQGIGQLYYQLNGTNAKFYNREITNITTILNTTPTLQETIQMENNTMAWNISSIPNISNRILNAPESSDARREMILLELKNETIFNDLTFSRTTNNQNRNIYLFNENKELVTTLTILDSGDYNTKNITWFNNENKPIKYILFDNEKEYDLMYSINPTNAGAIYDNAYNMGYQAGYEDGIPAGIQKGINENKFQIDPYSASYIAGYEAGEQDTNILGGMVLTIVESPINIFKQIFDFNILGIDISQFIFSLMSLLLIVFLIKKIIK